MNYPDFLKTLTGCPFCEHKNRTIMDSDKSFLTYAIAPYHKHHMLVIPKRHVASLSELSKEEFEDIDVLEDKALDILRKLGYVNMSLLVREGNVETHTAEDNKTIEHTHFHVIPNIHIGDLDHYGKTRRVMTEQEIDEVVSEIHGASR
jgi:diadenosine tetraphosphate (Ap4A) HIT family hydrolase